MGALNIIYATLIALCLTTGCSATVNGSFCAIAKPIRPAAETIAVMSDAEVRDVLAHNEKLTKLCGIKP